MATFAPNPAQISDVTERWRSLDGQDLINAEAWLADAWEILQVESPGLVDRINANIISSSLVVATLAEAVARKGRNSDGRRQQQVTVDDATAGWTLDSSIKAGELYFTDQELARLSGRSRSTSRARAYSVIPL